MRAVWSFWSAPYRQKSGWNWHNELTHLLAWVLSVELARRHYPETVLVTDSQGAAQLTEGLGLSFSQVHTVLDHLDGEDSAWWMTGKLEAYRLQDRPFIHLDYDVFLWKALPHRVIHAPLFAQNQEDARPQQGYYEAGLLERVVLSREGGWVPPEWLWYRSSGLPQHAACCGLFGGNDVVFIRHYAETALRFIRHPSNRIAFATMDKTRHNPLVEQFILCACAAHRHLQIAYLFPDWGAALADGGADEAGYTHLIANAKSDPEIARKLSQRVARDYPDHYERCLRYLESEGAGSAGAGLTLPRRAGPDF